MTPSWQRAAHDGDTVAMARELEAGGDVDARDRYGQTALMLTAVRGHAEAVGFLVDHGAALDHTAKFGLTALMLAVVNRHADIARALVEAGADVTLRGGGAPGFYGRTAHELALDRGDHELARSLEQGHGPQGELVVPS